MKFIYACMLAIVLGACHNSTENTAPANVDNTANKDTAFVPKDSLHNNVSIDSVNKDSSIKKQ